MNLDQGEESLELYENWNETNSLLGSWQYVVKPNNVALLRKTVLNDFENYGEIPHCVMVLVGCKIGRVTQESI